MFAATSLAIAVSLSMDSFAAALGRGACLRKPCLPEALRVGIVFGLCQLTMPVIGWLIGSSFAGLVETLDHWIALGLLVFVGGSMIRNALTGEPESCDVVERNSGWLALFATGVATSIDACAVGIGLALAEIDIAGTAALIGIVTFISGFSGVLLGRLTGPWLGNRAEIVGGLGLIAIGIKIAVDHTMG